MCVSNIFDGLAVSVSVQSFIIIIHYAVALYLHILYEPHLEKTGFLPMRNQRRRSAQLISPLFWLPV